MADMRRALPPSLQGNQKYVAIFTESAQKYLESIQLTPDYFVVKPLTQAPRVGDVVIFKLGRSTIEGVIETLLHHDPGQYLVIELGRLNKLL